MHVYPDWDWAAFLRGKDHQLSLHHVCVLVLQLSAPESTTVFFFLSSVPRGDRTQVHRLSVGVSSSLVGVLVVVRCELPGGYASIVLRVCKTVVVQIAVVNTW